MITHTIQIQTPTLTLTKVPVKLVPSPLLSASSSIRSAIDFLIAETSTFDSALASTTAGDRDSANNVPVAAAGAAYRLPRRVAAEIMFVAWVDLDLDFSRFVFDVSLYLCIFVSFECCRSKIHFLLLLHSFAIKYKKSSIYFFLLASASLRLQWTTPN